MSGPLARTPVPTTAGGPSRTLRKRASPPPPISSPVQHASTSTSRSPVASHSDAPLRKPSEKELANVHRRLGAEGVIARRTELVSEKEGQLKSVVEGHDAAVREKFHLERFVTLLEGWDPEHAKHDNSPVFLEWRRTNQHDLTDMLPPTNAPIAGPSRPRTSLPSRQTRRQAHEQSELLATVTATAPNGDASAARPPQVKGKGKAAEPVPAVDLQDLVVVSKGKGKGKAAVAEETSTSQQAKVRLKVGKKGTPINMPPPPTATPDTKGKTARRQTLGGSTEESPSTESEDIGGKGKKRSRVSLPNLPTSKKQRGAQIMDELEGSGSPAVESPALPSEPPEPTPPPAPLPSLAHLAFPPPPARPRIRSRPTTIWYTDPTQKPGITPKFSGDLETLLSSYILLEDTGPAPDLKSLELRAAREAYYRNRANWLLSQGRLSRLRDEQDDAAPTPAQAAARSHQKIPAPPARKQDYQEALMSHMVQVRNAMMAEAKGKPAQCRKIARMIIAHWEREEGKEEREQQALEREQKKKARDIVRALKKKWGLAVKIVRARILEAQKAEQDRLGKEHLQNMLQRSTGLLEAHRDEMAGRGEDEDEDEVGSEGTDEVSAAEESEEEGGVDGDGENDGAEAEAEGGEDEGDLEAPLENADAEAGHVMDVDVEAVAQVVKDEEAMAEEDEDEDEEAESDDANEEDEDDDEDARSDEEEDEEETGRADLLALLEDEPDGVEPDDGALGLEDDAEKSGLQDAPLDPATTAVEIIASAQTMANGHEVALDSAGTSGIEPLANGTSAPVSHAEAEPAHSPPVSGGLSAPSVRPDDELRGNGDIGADGVAPPVESSSTITSAVEQSPRRRRRVRKPAVLPSPSEADPDANDTEFADVGDDVSEKDHELDVEMEEAEGPGAGAEDSEDEGLLADADIPIEELLKRYGYPMPGDTRSQVEQNGDTSEIKAEGVETDKSLLDENLLVPTSPPVLIVEGKRQRRVRQVWTPEDNPPPPPKRVKIEEVEAEPESPEPTPSLTSEETEEEEDEEEQEEGKDGVGEGKEAVEGPKIRPPFLLRGTLRPYQHAGLEWLASLYANNMNGILADEMGLGKTIQTIALLGHLACDKGVWGQHLIIVPTSVILNWEMEFKKFFPGMKVLTYYGNQKERKEKRIGWHTENAWQVCITSYQIVLADQHIFRRKNWVYMILDEAHNIKNFRSQRWQTLLGFKAARRLLLTGTPLQNNLMELWSLLYFLMPHGVTQEATSVVGFANHKEFTEWFSNPMDKAVESGDTLDEETLETVAKLHTLLRPFILRRLKSEVETQLPGKFEHVVYCRLSKRQRYLYDEFMSRASTREALTSGGYLGVANTLMQLRKVCNHPDLFEVRPVRTSFAMERSVLADFEPKELLLRKRLLHEEDQLVRWKEMNLLVTSREDESAWSARSIVALDATDKLPFAIEEKKKGKGPTPPKPDTRTVEGWLKYREHMELQARIARWRSMRDINRTRCQALPIYGRTLLDFLTDLPRPLLPLRAHRTKADLMLDHEPPASQLVLSYTDRATAVAPLVEQFAVVPPNAVARDLPTYALPTLQPASIPDLTDPEFDTLHHATVKLQIAFPDASLLQYDCGKLQKLDEMLRQLKPEGHRVLIFTQMTRVLDILEMFLSYNGHRYLRLDGSTKIEDRQIITERFNSDPRIFCFIASSRSGGVGINLTGADTVFFYDSDWNPSMDRQCMDRAHRIGQTREVHIYRFVSSHTVEENMLKKANQKRLLDRVIIQEGDFTTEFFGRLDWRDMLDEPAEQGNEKEGVEDVAVEDEPEPEDVEVQAPRAGGERQLAEVFAQVEDEEDVQAARVAQGEGELDISEFAEAPKKAAAAAASAVPVSVSAPAKKARFEVDESGTPATPMETGEEGEDGEEDYDEDEPGGVDEYVLRTVEWDWEYFVNF